MHTTQCFDRVSLEHIFDAFILESKHVRERPLGVRGPDVVDNASFTSRGVRHAEQCNPTNAVRPK